ncbi:MAG TPA: MazG family protein [Pseudonocardia sp.]|jgi:XTP/dITP diphosphohydrolase|nr:MazG family protein [Pseudonocardia sp.]
MARTIVVLSTRLAAVLPAAALPALRAAARVLADGSVPAELATSAGAERVEAPSGWPAESCALLTTDAAHPLVASADAVVAVPEPAGAALLDAVAVMDRLRSPGGCPWDAEQTHLSLLQYLVEECYELYQAVEDTDRPALREELGDVLLQVLFHSRVAAEGGVKPYPPESAPFGIDEVAADLVRKLVDRHPHVFPVESGDVEGGDVEGGDVVEQVRTASDQEVRWEQLKRVEKRRESSVDGVALSQPAAALAAKLVSRASKAGLPAELAAPPRHAGDPGQRLFALVAEVKLAGADPEQVLREAARGFGAEVRAAESAARDAGLDPHGLTADDWLRYWPRDRGEAGSA